MQAKFDEDDIKKASTGWTLSHDLKLLETLEEFKNGLINKTSNVLKKLHSLDYEVKNSAILVSNLVNEFQFVGQNQFIENRVKVAEHNSSSKLTPDCSEQDILAKKSEEQQKIHQQVLQNSLDFIKQNIREKFVNANLDDESLSECVNLALDQFYPSNLPSLPPIIGTDEFYRNDIIKPEEEGGDIIKESSNDAMEIEEDEYFESDPEFILTPEEEEEVRRRPPQPSVTQNVTSPPIETINKNLEANDLSSSPIENKKNFNEIKNNLDSIFKTTLIPEKIEKDVIKSVKSKSSSVLSSRKSSSSSDRLAKQHDLKQASKKQIVFLESSDDEDDLFVFKKSSSRTDKPVLSASNMAPKKEIGIEPVSTKKNAPSSDSKNRSLFTDHTDSSSESDLFSLKKKKDIHRKSSLSTTENSQTLLTSSKSILLSSGENSSDEALFSLSKKGSVIGGLKQKQDIRTEASSAVSNIPEVASSSNEKIFHKDQAISEPIFAIHTEDLANEEQKEDSTMVDKTLFKNQLAALLSIKSTAKSDKNDKTTENIDNENNKKNSPQFSKTVNTPNLKALETTKKASTALITPSNDTSQLLNNDMFKTRPRFTNQRKTKSRPIIEQKKNLQEKSSDAEKKNAKIDVSLDISNEKNSKKTITSNKITKEADETLNTPSTSVNTKKKSFFVDSDDSDDLFFSSLFKKKNTISSDANLSKGKKTSITNNDLSQLKKSSIFNSDSSDDDNEDPLSYSKLKKSKQDLKSKKSLFADEESDDDLFKVKK